MYMKDNPKFIKMMKGGFGHFSLQEMWAIMTNLNALHVNTIHVQQVIDGTFICIVDRHTVEYYKKEHTDNV